MRRDRRPGLAHAQQALLGKVIASFQAAGLLGTISQPAGPG